MGAGDGVALVHAVGVGFDAAVGDDDGEVAEGAAEEVRAATGNRSVAAPADTAGGSQATIKQAAIRQVPTPDEKLDDVGMGLLYPFSAVLS